MRTWLHILCQRQRARRLFQPMRRLARTTPLVYVLDSNVDIVIAFVRHELTEEHLRIGLIRLCGQYVWRACYRMAFAYMDVCKRMVRLGGDNCHGCGSRGSRVCLLVCALCLRAHVLCKCYVMKRHVDSRIGGGRLFGRVRLATWRKLRHRCVCSCARCCSVYS